MFLTKRSEYLYKNLFSKTELNIKNKLQILITK